MNVLLIGPPGSGKGTQGARLAAQLGIAHIAAGDLLRAEVSAGTPLGTQVAELMARGDLVSDELMNDLMLPKVSDAAGEGGYLLDGFPRSLPQALEARRRVGHTPARLDAVVYLDVPAEELKRRILQRAAVEGRADDNEETVANRLRVFDRSTRPLVDYYAGRQIVHIIDASGEPDEITEEIVRVLARVPKAVPPAPPAPQSPATPPAPATPA